MKSYDNFITTLIKLILISLNYNRSLLTLMRNDANIYGKILSSITAMFFIYLNFLVTYGFNFYLSVKHKNSFGLCI